MFEHSPSRRETASRPVVGIAIAGSAPSALERGRALLLLLMALLLGSALSLGAAVSASAHDRLISTDPADGAVLSEAPSELTLEYSANIIELGTEVEVHDAGGTLVSEAPVRVEGVYVIQPLAPDLPGGEYTVTWRAVSSDGHPIDGSFVFTIDVPVVDPEPTEAPEEPGATDLPADDAGQDADAGGLELPWMIVIGVAGVAFVVALVVSIARRGRSGGLR